MLAKQHIYPEEHKMSVIKRVLHRWKRQPNILRLLVTQECKRNCDGCCNLQWELDKLPVMTEDLSPYKMILITGGEPMILEDERLKNIIGYINLLSNSSTKVILYTAETKNWTRIHTMLSEHYIDGLTITLHEQKDVPNFLWMAHKGQFHLYSDHLRLNIFQGVTIPKKRILKHWKIKKNIVWKDPCPLPKGEVFMRYNKP